MKTYPEKFALMMPMPGDWHLMKLAAETLKGLLWDGGLHDIAKMCGHHKDIYQWRDIHNILLALNECLHVEFMQLWIPQSESIEFTDFFFAKTKRKQFR